MSQPLNLIGHPISKRVFVLGAGFSSHLSGGQLPLLRQLGSELQADLPWITSFNRNAQAFDIERVLTDLDLDLIDCKEDVDRQRLEAQKRELVSLICRRLNISAISEISLKPAAELCLKLFSAGDYIVTFNWDCLLERLLAEARVWKPYDGYGWSTSFSQEGEGGKAFNPFFITILKLHGSVNFVRSSYGGEHLEILPSHGGDEYEYSDATLPVLTLPTYVKIFAEERGFTYIWREAIEAISQADVLVVLGYSLPKADALARLLLSFAGTNSPLKRVAIVNWSMKDCEYIQQQLREVATLDHPWPSFEEAVDWSLLPVEAGKAYDKLLEVLSEWPKGNLEALVWAIADREDFVKRLEFAKRLGHLTRKRID
jgi:hypothetical protein